LLLTYIYTGTIGLAFLASLVSFRQEYDRHLKLFSLLLGLTFLVECAAVTMMKTHHNNVGLYNSFMLVEFWTYGYYYYMIIGKGFVKRAIRWFLWVFPAFWVVAVFLLFGWKQWNSYVVIAGSLSVIFFSAAYYYQLFTQPSLVKLSRTPEFWIATGLILFYSCNLPYIGMLNFLVNNYLLLARRLMGALDILNIIMYSIFIFAYLCRIRTRR
jgi:hypothetical protein